MTISDAGPLAGLTVVAIEHAVAGPLCSRTFADLGARVIKIENPRGGDFARAYDDVVHGQAAHFVWLNRGKESVALDLKQPGGQDALHRLLARSDVLVSNLAPGATTRLGVDPDQLAARHPHLVALEISGYGVGGPLSHKRAYDLLVQAESGVCAITGWEGMPAKAGPPVADECAGLYGVIAVLAALHDRTRTTRGTSVAVSMFDTMAELMGYPLTYTRHTGIDQEPLGMGSPAVAPYATYSTAEGLTVVLGTTNDAEWLRLAEMIGRPDLAARPDLRRAPGRVARRAEIDDAIGAWCARHPADEVQAVADAAGIGNSRVNPPSAVVAHPHLVARDRWREVDSPGGPVTALVPPPIIRGHEPRMGAVPALGEHTDAVLADLGLDGPAVEAPRAAGAVGAEPVAPRGA